MSDMKSILLVEDNPNDVELTLEAPGGHNLASEVIIVEDGSQAPDYLYLRGKFMMRSRR